MYSFFLGCSNVKRSFGKVASGMQGGKKQRVTRLLCSVRDLCSSSRALWFRGMLLDSLTCPVCRTMRLGALCESMRHSARRLCRCTRHRCVATPQFRFSFSYAVFCMSQSQKTVPWKSCFVSDEQEHNLLAVVLTRILVTRMDIQRWM